MNTTTLDKQKWGDIRMTGHKVYVLVAMILAMQKSLYKL